MSDKTERQQIFGTDDEEDEYPMSQDDSSKLGGSAPRRESRVRITNQQKMQAVAHFQTNKGMTLAALMESNPGRAPLSVPELKKISVQVFSFRWF